MNKTTQAVEAYVEVTHATFYDLRLIPSEKGIGKAIKQVYTQEQVLRSIEYFRLRNRDGYNIYCRPIGLEYVLLDDLNKDVLADVATLKPCLLMETSPANFQAWLTLANVPRTREEAKRICRAVATEFNADLASADPEHVGRLPGYTNRKAKHQKPNGQYPYVILHRWANRQSLFTPEGGSSVPNSSTRTYHPASSGGQLDHSASAKEFGIIMGLLKKGKTDQETFDHLLSTTDVQARKGSHTADYLWLSIANAHKTLGR